MPSLPPSDIGYQRYDIRAHQVTTDYLVSRDVFADPVKEWDIGPTDEATTGYRL